MIVKIVKTTTQIIAVNKKKYNKTIYINHLKKNNKQRKRRVRMRVDGDQSDREEDTKPDAVDSQKEQGSEVFAQHLLCFESLFFLLFLSFHS